MFGQCVSKCGVYMCSFVELMNCYGFEFKTDFVKSIPEFQETDEDEENYNESSKGPSNADSFAALETAMEWYELSYSTTAAQENRRPCIEKTKMDNGTAKNK
ncbi:hypothetical protein TNCV_1166451 [Trichonephila clavipes]|uniref:Uncharacterized protein n=1 Tax=Trichonephila clavipes TaxID=2585209 RepID=A0A8X6SWN7_TRICX|nr:hypothetical protein TNCV_1166451 [Trichonephila clavipes]